MNNILLSNNVNEKLKYICKSFKEVKNISLYKEQMKATQKLLKHGAIEVDTGEGKSFINVITALCSLNKYQKIYIVTVNDYLAERDYLEMKDIFNYFGVKVSFNSKTNKMKNHEATVIYTSVNELVFDYLNDLLYNKNNIKLELAIIDEADYVLIDCANSGCSITKEDTAIPYKMINIYKNCFAISKSLKGIEYDNNYSIGEEKNYDFFIDKEKKNVFLTKKGIEFIEKIFRIDLTKDSEYLYAMSQVLNSIYIYKYKIDYLINDKKLIWIDEENKRLLLNTKKDMGLQLAIELKENLKISSRAVQEISISYQIFFSLFKKINILSATLKEVSEELNLIYGVNLIKIKPHNKSNRKINSPFFCYSNKDKFDKIQELINSSNEKPILIFEENDLTARELYRYLLKENKNKNVNLLVSENYELKEKELINIAGNKNNILITTSLTGRGTDIKLNDNSIEEIISIIAYKPQNSRVERQIIGRVGRNGKRGTVNYVLNLSTDIYFKKLLNINNSKKQEKIRKQMALKNERNSKNKRLINFRINFLLFEHYLKMIEIANNIDLNEIEEKYLSKAQKEQINNVLEKQHKNLKEKIFKEIYLYYLNTSFKEYKELAFNLSISHNVTDNNLQGIITYEKELVSNFNLYMEDLIIFSLNSMCNIENLVYKKESL